MYYRSPLRRVVHVDDVVDVNGPLRRAVYVDDVVHVNGIKKNFFCRSQELLGANISEK